MRGDKLLLHMRKQRRSTPPVPPGPRASLPACLSACSYRSYRACTRKFSGEGNPSPLIFSSSPSGTACPCVVRARDQLYLRDQPLLAFICALHAFLASAADMPELSDCCLAMQFFSDCLLAVACRCAGVEAAEGLVLSLVGASVALLEVESRCEGLEAELGDVSEGIVWLCAITIAPGARVIKAANKSVFRGLMRSSPVIERAA